MIAQELEVSLHMAFVEARQKQHEFITVEHLLLAMLDNPSAAEVLKACGVDIDELRGVLTDFINEHTPRLSPHSDADTQPTQGFQRVIQRAILHVQSSGKKEVTGANVLVAIFGEKESHAVYFLNQRGVTRLDVVNYIANGITKNPQQKQEKGEAKEEVPMVAHDGNIEIAFNGKYVVDALKAVHDPGVRIEMTESSRPAVFRPAEDADSYFCVIMPMALA